MGNTLEGDTNMSSKSIFHTQIIKFNREIVISGLASLLLYPENHQHTNYIENLIKISLQLKFKENSPFDYDDFQIIANSEDAKKVSQSYLDDPVNSNYVENVMFPDAEFLVLTGITQGGSFNVQNLISTILNSENKVVKVFANKVKPGIELLLTLSDMILKSAKITRHTESINYHSADIYFPDYDLFTKNRKRLILSQKELDKIMTGTGSNSSEFDKIITRPGEYLKKDTDFLYSHPILFKPFIKENSRYILTLPTSVLDTVRHYILSKMKKTSVKLKENSRKVPLRAYLFNEYRNYCENKLVGMFRFLRIRKKEMTLPKISSGLPICENIFEYDTDNKLIYSILIFDDFRSYDTKNPFTRDIDDRKINGLIQKRIKEVLSSFTEEEKKDIIICVVMVPMGRQIVISLGNQNSMNIYWILPFEELSVIARMRKLDIFDIRRFLIWTQDISSVTKVVYVTFLDIFAYYYKNNFSLYFSDESLPDEVNFGVNEGQILRSIAKRVNDLHLTKLGPTPIRVIRREDDEKGLIPIYFRDPEDGIVHPFLKLIEGYQFPFWVNIGKTSPEVIETAGWLFLEFSDMLAFWIWQFQGILNKIIRKENFEQIYLTFRFENTTAWTKHTDKVIEPKKLLVDFQIVQEVLKIKIVIPDCYITLFSRKDNLAEKSLFFELVSQISSYFDMDQEVQQEFEKIIPLGNKKKIHFFGPEDVLMQNSNLASFQQIREGDIEYYLQGLASGIGQKVRSIKEITEPKKKTKLLKRIVSYYYKLLEKKLSKLNKLDLVKYLISQYEVNVWNVSFMNYTRASQIECYHGFEGMVNELKDRNFTDVNTSISLRVLIEIISAKSWKGNDPITKVEYLELLAITHHIINWGIISDYNHLGIFNSVISILPSGRIGVSKEVNQRYDKFLSSKFSEDVSHTMNPVDTALDYNYLLKMFDNFEEEYKKAFHVEFGVTSDETARFIGVLYKNAIDQKDSVGLLKKSEFEQDVSDKLKMDLLTVKKLIDIFSLSPRDKYEIPPDGFESNDIWPWIYNRRISYIRKPLVQLVVDGEEYLIWSARNSYSSLVQLNQLIYSTRYKTNHSSDLMKKFIGKLVQIRGKYFENLVYDWVMENYPLNENLKNVAIGPVEKFQNDLDLGDIDVLSINKNTSVLYAIECKNINMGRSPREIYNEIKRFIGIEENEEGWIDKHEKRVNWLKNNAVELQKHFKLQNTPIIKSIIVTSEEIPSGFLQNFSIEYLSFYRLKENGLDFS